MDGVESAVIDFQSKTATVTCSTSTRPEAMVSALQKAGFGGNVKK